MAASALDLRTFGRCAHGLGGHALDSTIDIGDNETEDVVGATLKVLRVGWMADER